MDTEVWKSLNSLIDNGDGYSVSNLGNVRNDKTLTILKPQSDKRGYHRVSLYANSKARHYFVHRLVALAFLPNPLNKEQVNHIDGSKDNNQLTNLEWSTPEENIQHAFTNDLKSHKGGNNPTSILTEDDVRDIKEMLKNKYSGVAIAKKYNVSPKAISHIKLGSTWSHIVVDGFELPDKDRRNRVNGSAHHSSRVTEEMVMEIRSAYKTGKYTYKSLAERYSLSKESVGDIVRGKTWKHLL